MTLNLISILAERNANKIQEKIQPVLESFYDEGINVEERIYYLDSIYYLNYSIDEKSIKNYSINDFINIFKYCIANSLYEYIRHVEEPNFIQQIISTDYYYFDVRERVEIYKNSLNVLKEENKDIFLFKDSKYSMKSKIMNDLNNYLNNNVEININGFILFRLKDYLLELNDTVEKAVEDFLVDKEYNEFIKLLKYFVDIQEDKHDTIHVVFYKENEFHIYDRHNRLINDEYISNIAIEFSENEINEEDLLISRLITLAPNEIYVHKLSSDEDTGILKTIEKIFPNSIHYCTGCDLCNVKINANKD